MLLTLPQTEEDEDDMDAEELNPEGIKYCHRRVDLQLLSLEFVDYILSMC